MKTRDSLLALTLGGLLTIGGTPETTAAQGSLMEAPAFAGNGAPSGAHYNLNLIGVPKNKTATMTDNVGHRIFVPLVGKTRILLSQGDTFQVLDSNATDGSGSFQLPSPDPDGDGITEYSVFARALGKPGGGSKLTTAAIDPDTGDVYYSVESAVFVRERGGSKFVNVSSELLYVVADIDADGDLDRVPLFDERLQGYFWEYDNAGLKLVQLRFYPVSTNTNQ
jgi:hypothetical protein